MNKSSKNIFKSNYQINKNNLQHFIEKIENESKEKSKKLQLKNIDLSYNLPKQLYKKVNEIIKLDKHQEFETDCFDDDDMDKSINLNDDINKLENVKEPVELTSKKQFNESTLSDVLDKELKFIDIELNIEPKVSPRNLQHIENLNWFSEYLKKTRKERVIWPTKIYNFDRKFLEKSLYEQADELMDLSAEEFTDWINALSSDKKNNLNKELIKQLFAIGIEGDASKALYVEPKQIKAVPHAVAESFQLPEMSIENKVAKKLALDKRLENKSEKIVAFGKMLPDNLKQFKKQSDIVEQLKPKFPDDIRTSKVLFHGITHLKSTKALVNHLKESPDIQKPEYLKNKNVFNNNNTGKQLKLKKNNSKIKNVDSQQSLLKINKDQKNHTSLYEHILLNK